MDKAARIPETSRTGSWRMMANIFCIIISIPERSDGAKRNRGCDFSDA